MLLCCGKLISLVFYDLIELQVILKAISLFFSLIPVPYSLHKYLILILFLMILMNASLNFEK